MLFRALRVLFGPAWGATRVLLNPPLTYAPDGWETRIDGPPSKGWDFEGVVEAERMRRVVPPNLAGTGPLGFSHEHDDPSESRNVSFHNIHMTFAYVVALASRGKSVDFHPGLRRGPGTLLPARQGGRSRPGAGVPLQGSSPDSGSGEVPPARGGVAPPTTPAWIAPTIW